MDGGGGASSSSVPVYHEFVQAAKNCNPKYMSLIMPSRWFIGGKGLDDFREKMLGDQRISKIVDFPNFRELFPSAEIAGGVCYWLRTEETNPEIEFVSVNKTERNIETRPINEFDVLVRYNEGPRIIHSVQENSGEAYLDTFVSSRQPFGITSKYKPKNSGVLCWFKQRQGQLYAAPQDVNDASGYLNKWKLLIPKAPIAGQTDFSKPLHIYYNGNVIIAKPGECCSETYLVAGAFDSEAEAKSFKSYLLTKMVRYLVLMRLISQNTTKDTFKFVPNLEQYDHTFTDQELREKWHITDEDWTIICDRVSSKE